MVIKTLRDLMEKGIIKSMIFITHELPLLYNVTNDIMVMYAGQIVEKGSAQQAVFDPLHPIPRVSWVRSLCLEKGLRDHKLAAIPGVPPNLKEPTGRMPVADRCKYVVPECRGILWLFTRLKADALTVASSRKLN